MVTASKSGIPRNRSDRELPDYALKIRETRKACGLTQSRFAKKIGTTRTTVARWETGTRQPGTENYLALHRFAGEKSLDAADFFLQREQATKVSFEDKIKRNTALERLEAIEQGAATGQVHSKALLEDAAGDPAEVLSRYKSQIKKLVKETANGDPLLIEGILKDIATLEDIWLGRGVRAGRAAEAQRRQNKRLLAFQKEHSRILSERGLAEKGIFEILITKVGAFLDELKGIPEGTGAIPASIKEKILAACDDLSPSFRRLQGKEYNSYSTRLLQILEQAAKAARRSDDIYDLQETRQALERTLSQELPAMKAKKES